MLCFVAAINTNGDARRKFTQQLQENEMVLQVTAEQQDALQCCRMLRRTAPYTAVRWCGVAKSSAVAKCRYVLP